MSAVEQAERVLSGLRQLGTRRLIALGVIGVLVFALTGVAGFVLSRPSFEQLYSGLDRADVGRIGAALREAGINFDVSTEGTAVLVPYGQSAQARMLLAEKGLPTNANAGYELFDKLGSLGLTSFMQEVTRVRAIEGELASTLKLMRGMNAARVHIVLPDEGSVRLQRKPSSAAVVLRMESAYDSSSAQAIRHLVSSSVPGLAIDQVTVLTTDGRLLSSATDGSDAGVGRKRELEQSVSNEIQESVRRTLAPYLSLKNFQVSVAARLNTDKRETSETIFNPESRVERSVRVIKESQTAQNATSQNPASVDRNVPQERPRGGDGKQSSEENQKREELTNYELSSKRVSVVSGGYAIENVSIAVLLNKSSLAAGLGANPKPEDIDAKISEIEQLVSSAGGLRKDRGDIIKVSAVDFLDAARDLEPVPPPSAMEMLEKHSATLIKSLTALVIAVMIVWFGLRPAIKAIQESTASESSAGSEMADAPPMLPPGMDFSAMSADLPPMLPNGMPDFSMSGLGNAAVDDTADWPEQGMLDDMARQSARSPQKRLEHLVRFNEDQAVAVLRQWMREGTAA
ncbi:MAG: flagellar basal-body MS-ring/collar protein FliF [Beijerinckiaceae bacterium]|nr:flagellar basal-body MS-ring/collar protein FliF [Beijerinckiaceae bacterium]